MRTAVLSRKPVPQPVQQKAKFKQFAAPRAGWVANQNLAESVPGAAYVLENIFPTLKGGRLRGGSKRHATVSATVVESFLTYKSGSVKKMFAASDGKIFDVTLPADAYIAPTPAVTGQTSNYYSHTQFATAGGEYMVTVNGDDLHWVFDGAAWAQNTPAITGVSSADLSFVWSFKSRLFFVEKGTKSAWYLGVDAIGGAATEFSLAGIFKRGGSLLFGATWSLDAGDGLDDKCVFISDEGEVAVYEGTDPSSATTWSLVGRYDISKPRGMNATMQAGGDLLIATVDGLIPISAAVNKDPAAMTLAAISRNIEPVWKEDAFGRSSRPWEIAKWVEKNMALISVPANYALVPVESRWGYGYWGTFIWGGGGSNVLSQDAYCYVVNLQTGAWAKYTGWDVQSLAYHDGIVYFGTVDGRVMQAEVGGYDDEVPYVCRYCGLFDNLGTANNKHLLQARATWTYGRPFNDKVSFSTNYVVSWPSAPAAALTGGSSGTWDDAVWDESVWDAQPGSLVKARWVSIGRNGYSVAPMVQVTVGEVVPPDAELVSIDLTYESGGIVV